MKKLIFSCLVLLSGAVLFAAESEASLANRKTAERCLQLAETSIKKNDWKSALSHAELGLSYDDSVSDLYYIKASYQQKTGESRAKVLETISLAFEKDNWIKNNKLSARVMYADFLCDTCQSGKALEILNETPLIYSADAEFVRIKAYYRLGTSDSISKARDKIDALRRLYPKDERFPKLFFMFESLFMLNAERAGIQYVIPPGVKKIASNYIAVFPDYKKKEVETEIQASLFADGETKIRLLQAIGEKDNKNALFAYAALKAGVVSEEKAYNLFFMNTERYPLYLFESFSNLIKDKLLKENLKERLSSFSSILTVDDNLDLIDELVVKYDRGRPEYIYYDENNDEILEIYAACDFGVPLSISFVSENTDLFYGLYPAVQKVSQNSLKADYTFVGDSYQYSPFEMTVNPPFANIGSDFYIPFIDKEYVCPDRYTLMLKASSMVVQTYEREASFVKYLILDGVPKVIYFSQGGKQQDEVFAVATLEDGFPFIRYVDYDNDSVYETSETYDILEEGKSIDEEEKEILRKIFGDLPLNERMYLSRVQIDRDNDTHPEFSETYLGDGGKICSWDTDGNGIWDYEFIIYPAKPGEAQIQDTIFYDTNGIEIVTVTDRNGEPYKITKSQKELPVMKGYAKNYYWINKKQSEKVENTIRDTVRDELNIGVVRLVAVDGVRYNVIKVGKNIYCYELPPSENDLKVMIKETGK
jgi:hypothetical protein